MRTLMTILFNCVVFIAVALLASCGGSSATSGAGAAESGAAGYPLPAVPDSITDPVKRAEFAVMHYWDRYDFRGREQLSDTVYVEQSLVDFWALLSMAEPATARNAVNGLLDKAAIYPKQLALIDWLAGKYLDDPNSPMRYEDIYIMFPSGGDARALGIGSEKAAASFFLQFQFYEQKIICKRY